MEIFGIICAVIFTLIIVFGIFVYLYCRGLGMPSIFKKGK